MMFVGEGKWTENRAF